MKLGWFGAFVVLLLTAVIGTILGQVVGLLLPSGVLHDIFFKGISIGLKHPMNLDLSVMHVVFGITLSINPITLAGLLLGIYIVVRLAK